MEPVEFSATFVPFPDQQGKKYILGESTFSSYLNAPRSDAIFMQVSIIESPISWVTPCMIFNNLKKVVKPQKIVDVHSYNAMGLLLKDKISDSLLSWIGNMGREWINSGVNKTWAEFSGGQIERILSDVRDGVQELINVQLLFGDDIANVAIIEDGPVIEAKLAFAKKGGPDFENLCKLEAVNFFSMVKLLVNYPLLGSKDWKGRNCTKQAQALGWGQHMLTFLNDLENYSMVKFLHPSIVLEHPSISGFLRKQTLIRKLNTEVFYATHPNPTATYFLEMLDDTALHRGLFWKKRVGTPIIEECFYHGNKNKTQGDRLFRNLLKLYWDSERHIRRMVPSSSDLTDEQIFSLVEKEVGKDVLAECYSILIEVFGRAIMEGVDAREKQDKGINVLGYAVKIAKMDFCLGVFEKIHSSFDSKRK